MVERARCPTADPNCMAASIGPMVAIHRASRSAGPSSDPKVVSGSKSPGVERSREVSMYPRVPLPPPGPASLDVSPGLAGLPASSAPPGSAGGDGADGSAMASSRNRQSSTVCHAHAPGATAAISMVAPVGVIGSPVSSATCSSAMCASSSNLIRSAGSTLLSGSPPLATPWASVRARSMRPPPGDDPPMSWRRSPRICSRKLPPAPGPGNATPRIVGGARPDPSGGYLGRPGQPSGVSANCTVTTR